MHLKRFLSAIFILIISTQAFAICEAELEPAISSYMPMCQYQNTLINSTKICNQSEYKEHLIDDMNRISNGTNQYYNLTEPGLTETINYLTANMGKNSRPEAVYKIHSTNTDRLKLCTLKEYRNKINKSSTVVDQSNSTSSQSQNQSHPPDSLQARQIQQNMKEAQQQAQQNQQRVDQARQGKRKTHDPDAEAHDCIEVDTKSLYGGFKNKCSYPVSYGYCVNNPRKGAWTDSTIFSCAGMAAGKPTAGGQSISANGYDVNHTKGGDSIYYFACKKPAYAMDLTVVIGQGIQGRCGTIGGN